MLINTYQNCKNSNVQSSIDINKVFEQIHNGNDYKLDIEYARSKYGDKKVYSFIKESQIPTFTPNATFSESRKYDNIISTTGLLYLDMDNETKLDITNELVYASWLSISGKGRGVLCKVDGVDRNNIKSVYKTVSNTLGIGSTKIDYTCADISRQTIFSYDEDIYVNEKSTRIHTIDILKNRLEPKKEVLNDNSIKGGVNEDLIPPKTSNILFYDNTHLVDLDGQPYKFYENKIHTSKVWIPNTIQTGNRYKTILAIMNNLVGLNPTISNAQILRYCYYLNDRCIEILSKEEIIKIYQIILNRKENDEIELIPNSPRSIIVDPSLSKKSKQKLYGWASGQVRANKSIQKIRDCLDNWDLESSGKVTNKKIADLTGLYIDTVKKYSPDFKEQKNKINK